MVTVDEAIQFLNDARRVVGGDACLILCLEDSEVSDTTVTALSIIKDDNSRYVEVLVRHEELLMALEALDPPSLEALDPPSLEEP